MFVTFSREEIAVRAYLIWEASGRQSGRDVQNWLQAEQELSVQQMFGTACFGCESELQHEDFSSEQSVVTATTKGM